MNQPKIKTLIVSLAVVFTFFISTNQIYFTNQKYQIFLNEYNQELWANHTADFVFWGSYVYTVLLVIFGYKFITLKKMDFYYLKWILGIILIISISLSIFASIWLFNMHNKHMLVGYTEWISHCKGLNN